MTDIELRYFPVHGFRGLMTRMVMDLGEIKYSEKIVQIRDWPVEKPSKLGCMKQESNKYLDSLMGFLPELKINGELFAQTTPMLVYLSKIGKMDQLTPIEEFKSGMMIQTSTDAFVSSVLPAFSQVGISAGRDRLDILREEPKEEHRVIFHKKAIEGLKGWNFP